MYINLYFIRYFMIAHKCVNNCMRIITCVTCVDIFICILYRNSVRNIILTEIILYYNYFQIYSNNKSFVSSSSELNSFKRHPIPHSRLHFLDSRSEYELLILHRRLFILLFSVHKFSTDTSLRFDRFAYTLSGVKFYRYDRFSIFFFFLSIVFKRVSKQVWKM